VLEGVLGPRKNGARDFIGVSQRTWQLLNEHEREQYRSTIKKFREAYPDLFLRLSVNEVQSLFIGAREMARSIRYTISLPMEERIESLRKFIQDRPGNYDNSTNGDQLYRAAGCQSTRHVEARKDGVLYERGVFEYPEGTEEAFCGCRTKAKDYDPSKLQIVTPIIYINGDQDPAAPIQGAKAHFNGQHQSNKVMVVVKDGGHGNTWRSLSSCVDQIYSAALSGNREKLKELERLGAGCNLNSKAVPGSEKATQ